MFPCAAYDNIITMGFTRPAIVRPPHEADSYFLPITSGCSNSFCTFCNYFYGHRLALRDVSEVKEEIDALFIYKNKGQRVRMMPEEVSLIADQWDGRNVFLQDGDALVYPFNDLQIIIEHLNHRFPRLEKITCFGTTQDVLRRSVEELGQLKKLKLRAIYLGVESGDDGILRDVNKGVDAHQTIQAGKRIKEAGILCPVTIILGLGGTEKSREHALATARLLSEMDPDSVDALTLTPVEGTPIYEKVTAGEFSMISPMQSLQELKLIIEHSRFSNCLIRSIHASNYLSVQGYLPRDREKLIAKLDSVLSCSDPGLLRPEWSRGL